MAHAYLDLNRLKERLNLASDDTHDAHLRGVLEAVSAGIDQHLSTSFQPRAATRYFTARRADYLRTPNLLSVASLKTDHDGDGAFEREWDAADYVLLPLNAPEDGVPYHAIEVAVAGNERLPLVTRGVEIVGQWGYRLELSEVAALAGALSPDTATFLLDDGNLVDPLCTLLVDDEQMYVTARAADEITVVRGVNGTVAAAHSMGAAVYRYHYPPQVSEAAALQAVRVFRRRDAPFGVVGGNELAAPKTIPLTDPDAKGLLRGFGRWVLGSV